MLESLYKKDCIRTYTGTYVNLKSPESTDIFAADIAIGLARECRFGNHTKRIYSVAEHSIWCMQKAEELYPADTAFHFACLMHDAHEAYLKDLPTPVAKCFGESFKEEWDGLKVVIQEAINMRFGIRYGHNNPRVMQIDKLALEWEWENKVLAFKGFPPLGEKAATDLFIHHLVRLCKVPHVIQPYAVPNSLNIAI